MPKRLLIIATVLFTFGCFASVALAHPPRWSRGSGGWSKKSKGWFRKPSVSRGSA